MSQSEPDVARKPAWLRRRFCPGTGAVRRLLHGERLHTVCEEAACPNRDQCWGQEHTATFLILGSVCTRHCRFCHVEHGQPAPPDPEEPAHVAAAAAALGLRYVVITMVTRDDLPDGGATALAATVHAVRGASPGCRVEVLASDLANRRESLQVLLAAAPDVVGHNLETVLRLTPAVRSAADYDRSLAVLLQVRELSPATVTKSGLMLGLGETRAEVLEAMDELRGVGVDLLTLGQYLQPSRAQLPVVRYWTPEEFDELAVVARTKGFAGCAAGPLVRSSFQAERQYAAAVARGDAGVPSGTTPG